MEASHAHGDPPPQQCPKSRCGTWGTRCLTQVAKRKGHHHPALETTVRAFLPCPHQSSALGVPMLSVYFLAYRAIKMGVGNSDGVPAEPWRTSCHPAGLSLSTSQAGSGMESPASQRGSGSLPALLPWAGVVLPQRLTEGLPSGWGLPRPRSSGAPSWEMPAPPPQCHDAPSLSLCYKLWTRLPSASPLGSQKSNLLIKKGTVAASSFFPLCYKNSTLSPGNVNGRLKGKKGSFMGRRIRTQRFKL